MGRVPVSTGKDMTIVVFFYFVDIVAAGDDGLLQVLREVDSKMNAEAIPVISCRLLHSSLQIFACVMK